MRLHKRIVSVSLLACFCLFVTACTANTTPDDTKTTEYQNSMQEGTSASNESMPDDTGDNANDNTLIIYYSYSGNTEMVAKLIQEKIGGDLYKIETVRDYPANGSEVSDEAAAERESGNLPELKGELPDISAYERIFVGGPVWTYTVSTPLMSYLSQTDFAGKAVVPFWTDAGTPGDYEKEFINQAQNAAILPGLGLSNVSSMEDRTLSSLLDGWLTTALTTTENQKGDDGQ
ncbi:MAG: flavodoxin [Eubacteriales bacterium]|nr:flavodoxin [Eubacteriales bacterium]